MAPPILVASDCEPDVARQRTRERRVVAAGVVVGAVAIALVVRPRENFSLALAIPVYIIVAGLILASLGAALAQDSGAEWMAFVGMAVAAAGSVVRLQMPHHAWLTWGYAWPLVFPAALGIGVLMVSARTQFRSNRNIGLACLALAALLLSISAGFYAAAVPASLPGWVKTQAVGVSVIVGLGASIWAVVRLATKSALRA